MPKKYLPPIIPSAKIDKEYRNALFALIEQMQRSVEWYCKAAFKPVEKESEKLGLMDADPVNNLQRVINQVKKRYIKRFNELAGKLPKEVVEKIAKEVKRKIKSHLIDEMTVELHFSKAEKMLLNALTKENVALIKSIPQEYFKRVEYDIMSTVSEGRDMQDLSDKLSKGYGITRRRAVMIAYDQTNKITEKFDRANKIELGLFQAEWKHSHASQEPRPSHLEADGKTYDIRKGMYIVEKDKKGKVVYRGWCHPASRPNCNCFSRTILPTK
jgi:uncharacterized protein with gpF-like domain